MKKNKKDLEKINEKENKIVDKRFRNFLLVIYEDDLKFRGQLNSLLQEGKCAYIRHDKDLDDEGKLKKPHYHIVLNRKDACTISSLSKRNNVEEHMIEPIKKSFNGALKYLIHYNCNDKYEYEVEDVKFNDLTLERKFLDLVNKEIPEVEKVMSIQDFIESCNDYIDIGVLGRYVQKINQWDAFRRNITYFIKLLDSHNGKISSLKFNSHKDYYDSKFV